MTRRLNPDRVFTAANGSELVLPGRSLMFVRNVGHLMTNPAILDANGDEIPEGIMDGMFTAMIALHDLNKAAMPAQFTPGQRVHREAQNARPRGSRLYLRTVRPYRRCLGMARNTLKVGIMDEERRTTINLKECIRAASERLVFINTGFLDRTGDEIHTSMEAGAMTPKGAMKQEPWINAYEDWNVDIGLRCGLPGKAQIGKGMWAMPDLMADMMKNKIAHPRQAPAPPGYPRPPRRPCTPFTTTR